ncbi:hypothetical protein FRX31_022249 [Thalictrum thalictroides]|uniref:Myb/SANT-like domain-containing protein n=1 Tax=Thalictrum thalictroides TaxID=46969 RepID=A0A7J6VSU7_THATH|nr:hypothetical protein FRX31_022249 [Thalictrum thalictroides]
MESDEQAPRQSNVVHGKLFWSTEMDDCMLEVFLCHLAEGRRTHQGWKKAITYTAIREALMTNLRYDVSLTHIENRVKTMRTHILAYKTLKASCSGFGWDSETMRLTADERVWDEAIQANPTLKSYRKKQLPRFLEWVDVLGENSANGNIQRTGFTVDVDTHMDESINVSPNPTHDPLLNNSMRFEAVNLDDDGATQHTSVSPPLTQPKKANKLLPRKRKSMSMVAGLKEEVGNMRGSIDGLVDVIKEKNHYEDIIWDQISNAIWEIEDMEEDIKVDALELFSGDHVENLKRCFLRIPVHKRKDWLLKKINNSS